MKGSKRTNKRTSNTKQARKEDMKIVNENNLAFAPAMHPRVTGLTDKEGLVIKRILEFAK